jgi:5S rRNA maturation endonuclease (ribonuclease M5)
MQASKPKKSKNEAANPASLEVGPALPRQLPFFNPWEGVCLYHQAPNPLFNIRPLLSGNAVKLYYTILDYCCTVAKSREIDLPARELARLAGRGVSTSRVGVHLRQLEKYWLIKTRPSGKHNRQIITICDPLTGEPVSPEKGSKIDPLKGLSEEQRSQFEGSAYDPSQSDNDLEEQYEPQSSGNHYKHRRIKDLTEAEIIKYYSATTDTTDFKKSGELHLMAHCHHHGDGQDVNRSLSINRKNGKWICFGCRGQGVEVYTGNLPEFEKRRSNCDYPTAVKNIIDIISAQDIYCPTRTPAPEWIPKEDYVYVSPDGKPLFGVWRFPPKEPLDKKGRPSKDEFRAYHIDAGGKKVSGAPEFHERLPYNLDQIMKASVVLVVEGEKDCNNVSFLGLVSADDGSPLACTTNMFGAEQWVYHYSKWLEGKRVIILGDRDVPGVNHVQKVAESLKKYASEIRISELTEYPVLPEHGKDVSDYLTEHSADDLVRLLGGWVRLPDDSNIEQEIVSDPRVDEESIEV